MNANAEVLTARDLEVLRAICNEHGQSHREVRTYIVCMACNVGTAAKQAEVMASLSRLRVEGLITNHEGRCLPTDKGQRVAATARAPAAKPKPQPVAAVDQSPAEPSAVDHYQRKPLISQVPEVAQPQPEPEPLPPPPMVTTVSLTLPRSLHPETRALVVAFAAALADKLRAAELKYGHSAGWRDDHWREVCIDELHRHVAKGDPLDVAAYCGFCWHHGWPTCREALPVLASDLASGCDPELLNRAAAMTRALIDHTQRELSGDERDTDLAWLHETGLMICAASGELPAGGDV
ncbi:hypothetical protein PRZ61_12435 [Halomonas pacifica]|uniref:hypothetical protein n=1 Tax=Bisbaumannia pacifica TaxID=77098 RepID=UPI00235857F7|nr:hypothetical protein [Halomonas pacifica]MDC8804249.1 hypothetical protein [Halomonas pacifica]